MSENQETNARIVTASHWLEVVVSWIEVVVALILTVVVVIAVVLVGLATTRLVSQFPTGFTSEGVFTIIKAVLDTFIVIELFRITVAYARHRDVVPTVLETALVVAAREVVVIEAGAENPLAAAAVGGTLVAIGLTAFLLRRADIIGPRDRRI